MVTQGWFVGIGSNLTPSTNIPLIMQLLLQDFSHIHTSASIQTPPMGMDSANNFINLVIYLESSLSEVALIDLLKNIEVRMGRPRDIKNRKLIDRTADLDPLCYIATPDKPANELIIPTEAYLNGPFLELAIYLHFLPADTPLPSFTRLPMANGLFGQKATTIHRDGTPRHERII